MDDSGYFMEEREIIIKGEFVDKEFKCLQELLDEAEKNQLKAIKDKGEANKEERKEEDRQKPPQKKVGLITGGNNNPETIMQRRGLIQQIIEQYPLVEADDIMNALWVVKEYAIAKKETLDKDLFALQFTWLYDRWIRKTRKEIIQVEFLRQFLFKNILRFIIMSSTSSKSLDLIENGNLSNDDKTDDFSFNFFSCDDLSYSLYSKESDGSFMQNPNNIKFSIKIELKDYSNIELIKEVMSILFKNIVDISVCNTQTDICIESQKVDALLYSINTILDISTREENLKSYALLEKERRTK